MTLAGPVRALPGRPSRPWLPPVLLILAVALCYANSLRVPFLMDDPRPGKELVYDTRPLVWASFALNRAISGGDTWSYHVVSLLAHGACALVLLGVLRRAAADVAPELAQRTRDGLALVTVLLWACHPLQTEAVTYLSQRAEMLGSLFLLLVVYGFQRSTSAARPLRWQALCLVALGLGFATKEIIATAPLLVWLYDAALLGRGPLGALRARKGFYATMLVAGLAFAAVFFRPLLFVETAGFALRDFGALEYACTQPGVILHYLRLSLWPHPLCFDYGWPIARTLGEILPQAALLGALALAGLVLLVRRSWIGFALAWFFVVLAPTSSFVAIKDPAVEHRMYLALATVVLLVVVAGWWLCTRYLSAARFLPVGLSAVLVVACAAGTIRRNRDYRSAVVLWQSVVDLAPDNPRGRLNLSISRFQEARPDARRADMLEALALSCAQAGDYGRAVELVEQALTLAGPQRKPEFAARLRSQLEEYRRKAQR